jgi:Tfp pilus assembly protein PilX
MSADSIIRADASAYPGRMRRLMVLVVLAVVGLAVYRSRVLDRREQELAIGPYADDAAA